MGNAVDPHHHPQTSVLPALQMALLIQGAGAHRGAPGLRTQDTALGVHAVMNTLRGAWGRVGVGSVSRRLEMWFGLFPLFLNFLISHANVSVF